MSVNLTKTERILHKHPHQKNENFPYFADDIEVPVPTTGVYLDLKSWEDMGSPETLTVAIRPGDHLNDKESSDG